MTKNWKLPLIILVVLVAGFGLWLVLRPDGSNRNGSDSDATLKLGVATWIGYGPLYIAQEKDFFSEADVQLRRIDDTAVYNSAMLRGDIDGFCNTLDSFALAAAAGVEGRVIYCFDESAGADGLVAKPSIKSLGDLKGRRVAAQTGWPGHFFMLYLTKNAGLSPQDFTHINLDSDKAGSAFMSGELDAAVTWEPWLSKIRTTGEGHILASSQDHPGIIVDALIVRPSVLKEKEAAVQILVDGCAKAIEYWRAQPEEGNAIVAKHFGLSTEEVGDMVKGVRFLDKEANRDYLRQDGRCSETMRMASETWLEAGVIQQAPDVSDAVTDRYIQ